MKVKCIAWALFGLVLGLTGAVGATLGISEHARGIASQYWYGYSGGAPSTYYLAHPTLSADDTAVAVAATQTLTAKTLTSPTITSPTITSPSLSGATIDSSTITGTNGTFSTLKWNTMGQVTVDYGAGSDNSTLTTTQAAAFEVIASNAGGAANLIVPATPKLYLFKNSSGQAITVKTATGTGIEVANAKYAILYCDGTNVVRVTADT